MSMRHQRSNVPYLRSLLSLLLLISVGVSAQQYQTHELRIQGGPDALSGHVQKNILELIGSLDPGSRISFHEDLLKIKITATIGREELLAELNGAGVGSFVYLPHDRAQPPVKALAADPVQDEAGMEALKNAWREAYPIAYQKYLDQLEQAAPVKHE